MAEINGLDDIQNGVEHISEVLDSMRAQNAMNAGDMDKVLANINSRLETLSNDEESDLIKVYLAELKRSLDERHSFVSTKFGEIEGSFKSLVENADQALKADELRQVFDIIATNLNVSSKEVAAQKELLTELSLKMEDLKQDDSATKDILKNISVLKVEIEKFNNGFESIIVNLNDNFQEVSQTLLKIDPTGVLDSVKKDIENIFLSSNAVLSALQVIDRKNRDLEEVLNHVVTKEDFVLERDQVANLISQNIQLTDYISKLPTIDSVSSLSQKVDTAVGVINALKNVLNETSDQNQKMLVAQLDNLETKISNISSEEEFVGFKKELSAFAQEIIQSTNLMRADLMNTNSELQGLVSFLGAVDIKNTLEHFSGLAQIAEENIKVNLNEMTEKFLKETEQTRIVVAGDVKGNLQNVEQKIDSVERNIVESSKNNFTNILEGIQSVLTNVFAMKNEIKLENVQSAESLDEKLQDLRDGVLASKDAVVVNSQQNLQSLLEGIQTLSEELELAKESLGKGSEFNLQKIISTVEKLSSDLSSVKQVLSQGSQENLENILSQFEKLSQELSFSKMAVMNSSQENFGNVLSSVEKNSQEILEGQRNLGQGSRDNLENILSSVARLSQELSSAKEGLCENSKENFENILAVVDRFSQEISVLKDGLNANSQENLETILSNINRVSKEVFHSQGVMTNGSKENLESILSSVAELSSELSSAKEGLSSTSQENFDNILSVVDNFSQQIEALSEHLSSNSQSNFESLKEITGELSTSLVTFKNEIQVTAKSNTAWLKSTVDALSQELQMVKDALETKSQVNYENITSRISEISTKIEEAHDFTNTNLYDNISELKSSISALPAFIQENQTVFEDEKRVLIEQNSKNIEELIVKIQNLTKGVVSKDNPFKEEVVFEFANLNSLLRSVQEDLSQKNVQAYEEIKANIQALEGLVSQVSSGSEVSLYNVQTKLTEYLQLIQDTTQSSDLKLENSINELVEIKTQIKAVKEGVEALNSDESLGEMSREVNSKLEGILSNIAQFEASSNQKNQDNLQNTLTVLEEQFQVVITSLQEHKTVSSASSADILQALTEKMSEIQEQVTGTNTNVVRILNARVNEIVGGFAPIKESIEKLAQVDVAQLIDELKNKLDESYTSLTEVIKENLQEDSAEVFEKTTVALSEAFGALNVKLENLYTVADLKTAQNADELKDLFNDLSKQLSSGIELIVTMVGFSADKEEKAIAVGGVSQNEFLSEKFEEIETKIFSNSQKNVDTLENTIKNVLEQIQEQGSAPDKIKEAVSSTKEEVFEKLDKLEATLILNQSDAQYSIIEKIEQKLEEKGSLARDNFEELISLKAELLEEINSAKNENGSLIQTNLDELISVRAELSDEINNAKNESGSLIKGKVDELISLKDELIEGIKNSSNEFQQENGEKIDYIKSEISELLSEITNAKNENNSLARENFEELISLKVELLEEINSAKNENISLIKGKVDELISLKNELIEGIKNSTGDSQQENSEKIDCIKSEISELLSEITNAKNENNSLARENFEELISLKAELLEEINSAKNENGSLIKGKIEELISLKADLLEEVSNTQSELQKENLSLVKNSIDEFTALKSELLEKIADSTSEFQHENSDKMDCIKSEMTQILDEINKAQEGLSAHKLDIAQLLKIKDEDVISQFSSIENTILEGISQNVEEFKTKVEITAQAIEDKISLSEENYKSSSQALLGDIKSSFSTKVEENFDDLKSFIEVIEGRKDFNLIIDNLKTEVFEKFSILADDIEEAVSSISVKKDLDELRVGVEASVNDLMETLYDRIVLAIEDYKVTQDVLEKSEEITRRVEDLKRAVTEDVSDKLDEFALSLDRQSTDFSNLISEIAVSLVELKENYVDLSLNSSMEISNLLSNVNDKIDDVSGKLDKYDFSSIIESAKSQMLEEIASVKDSVSAIDFAGSLSEDFQIINQKIDVMNMSSDGLETNISEIKESLQSQEKFNDEFKTINQKLDVMNVGSGGLETDISEIKESLQSQEKFNEEFKTINQKLDVMNMGSSLDVEITEIKDSIESQSKFIEDLKALEQLDKLSKLDGISNIQNEIKKTLSEFEGKLNEISSQKVENKDDSAEIKDELKAFKKEFIESVLNIFDQISFVVEAEDIKDFVEEKADEIKTTLGENLSEILSSLEILHGKEKSSEGGYSDVEAENIKDFVEVQADEIKTDIKENLKSSLGDNFNDILSSLDILHDKANSFDGGYYDIKNEIADVKKHLQQLQNTTEDSDYSYTFQDIESDIAKVRLILNEISQTKSEDNFDQMEMMDKLGRLNELDKLDGLDRLSGLDKLGGLDKMTEDIMSISNRTNKLLLTSDESYNNLKLNLDEFRNVVYSLEDKVRYLDNTEATNRIEKKIETVNQLAISCVKSDKIFNQAFTYLAEWVDSASENMATITDKLEKVTEIDSVKQSIAEIKKTVSKKTDLAAMLDEISDKFEQQQSKIERLEEKIDDLSNGGVQSSSQFDLKAIVAEVLEQFASSAPKADAKLTKKVDAIDKQLTKLGKNIEKLTSYVDAE